MPIATVKQLCRPNAVVTSDSLVEQVAQIEDLATGKAVPMLAAEGEGADRLAGKSEDGAFYLTQAMGGGKTHSLIAFGLLSWR